MAPTAISTPTHGDRRDRVVASILERIIHGSLRGGDRLVTQELVDLLQVSATPVREAFAVLAGLGVIDLVPNRGAIVHQFTAGEIEDIGRVRRALEVEAIRGACGRIPPSHLRQFEEDLQKLGASTNHRRRLIRKARELDTKLHDAIRDNCGNAFLVRELKRLSYLFRSFRDATWVDAETRDDVDRLGEEIDEHLAITRALRAKDSQAAVKALEYHLRSSTRYWSRLAGQPSLSVMK